VNLWRRTGASKDVAVESGGLVKIRHRNGHVVQIANFPKTLGNLKERVRNRARNRRGRFHLTVARVLTPVSEVDSVLANRAIFLQKGGLCQRREGGGKERRKEEEGPVT